MKILKGIGYWFIQYTWGSIMTILGTIVAFFLLITGHKPYRFHYNIYFILKCMHGCGSEIGPFFLVADDCKDLLHLKQHEAGHGLQNLWWGPLNPFLITIPSAFRFWMRDIKTTKKKYIFAGCITGIIILIGLIFWLLSMLVFNSLIGVIISGLITIYGTILFNWSIFFELSLYKDNLMPTYDSIWFEGQASRLGEKYFN